MTATATPIARPIDLRAALRRIHLRPAEGWLTVAMVMMLVVTFAWSLDDAGWVPNGEGSTGYLAWLAIAGVAVGLLGVKLGLGRWKTDLLGGVVAGLVLPLVAGSVVLGSAAGGLDLASLTLRYHAAGTVAFNVWADLVRDGKPFTNEFGHYHMVFGGMVWAAGQVAATAVFARRRPIDAVVVVGLLLLTNMAVTARDQLQLIVLFSIAALVLLIRAHTFEEQVTWVRRRIGDPTAVSDLYLRGGAVFVAAAVAGAILLTASASSAPLQGFWSELPQKLVGVSQWISKFAPSGGDPRPLGAVGFGSSATTNGLWSPSTAIAFTAQVPPNDAARFKWRAGTYAVYDGVARWSWGDTSSAARETGASVLADTGDDPTLDADRREVRVTVTPGVYGADTIVSPQTILRVDRPTTLRLDGNRFTTVESAGGSGSYVVSALVPTVGGSDGLTQNRLRVAGTAYPADITKTYLAVPDGTLGPASLAILAEVESIAAASPGPAGNPYNLAIAMQEYLRSSRFTYSADVRDLVRARCGGISSVECFARIRTGYCEYYASIMAMLLRKDGIPTRIAYGFLPGERTPDGNEIVEASSAHWWVEVYFPRYGWVEFDPTGGNPPVGRPQVLPSGAPETPRPSAVASFVPGAEASDPIGGRRTAGPGASGTTGASSSGSGPFIAIAFLLIVGVAVVAVGARRRSPRKPMHPDQAWGSLGRLASRFGVGPRPAQTVYEYAGTLGDAMPSLRAELTTVARAKVEVAYGRQELGVDRLRSVGDAYRHLRYALVRFGLRRFPRRRR